MTAPIMVVSGLFGALSNLCMRRSMDQNGTAQAFFVFQLSIACIVTTILYPMRYGFNDWNLPIIMMGFLGGCALGSMKIFLGKALQKGPPALTFAAVNAASVMPAFVIVFAIGQLMDYHLTIRDIMGSILVLIGLFWAGWTRRTAQSGSSRWFLFAAGAFSLQVLFLVVTQFRAILISTDKSWLGYLPSESMSSSWFGPVMFAAAAGMHSILYLSQEWRLPHKWEFSWGIAGGLFSGISTFLFIFATEATALNDSTMIFSIFSVSLIIFCNLWGQWLYKEKVNWPANILCILGILIASK